MSNLQGQAGEVRCTVTIKRAATGKEEQYELVGKVTAEQAEQLITEGEQDGCKTPTER